MPENRKESAGDAPAKGTDWYKIALAAIAFILVAAVALIAYYGLQLRKLNDRIPVEFGNIGELHKLEGEILILRGEVEKAPPSDEVITASIRNVFSKIMSNPPRTTTPTKVKTTGEYEEKRYSIDFKDEKKEDIFSFIQQVQDMKADIRAAETSLTKPKKGGAGRFNGNVTFYYYVPIGSGS